MGGQVGYARVSTRDQHVDGQVDVLHAAGCSRIYAETASGTPRQRPGLAVALDYVRPDVLAVTKLDRLGRGVSHVMKTVNGLEVWSVGFRSLGDRSTGPLQEDG